MSLVDQPEKIEELMTYFFSNDLRLCQRASFPIITIADHDINLLRPYIPRMISNYSKAPHDAYKRNVMRILQFIDLPEELEGEIYDLCMGEFCNTKIALAIRVFAVTTLCNICVKHPDLKQEVLPTLFDYQNTGTVGFENRLRKEIKRISSLPDKYF